MIDLYLNTDKTRTHLLLARISHTYFPSSVLYYNLNNFFPATLIYLFFFSSRRRHTRYIGDWSSDVCSSDLGRLATRPDRTPFRCGDGKHRRRRSTRLAGAGGPQRFATSLWQIGNPPGPQNGPHHLAYAEGCRPPSRLRMSVSDGSLEICSLTSALNFSNCITFSIRASRNSKVSFSSSLPSVNQRSSVDE